MFDILIPSETEVITKPDTQVMVDLIVEGLKYDCIDELHSAVEYVDCFTPVGTVVNGNDVEGLFKKIVSELKRMSSEADVLARQGATVDEMAKSIIGEYFTFDDIKAFKIEVYGSVITWKAVMQQEMA